MPTHVSSKIMCLLVKSSWNWEVSSWNLEGINQHKILSTEVSTKLLVKHSV